MFCPIGLLAKFEFPTITTANIRFKCYRTNHNTLGLTILAPGNIMGKTRNESKKLKRLRTRNIAEETNETLIFGISNSIHYRDHSSYSLSPFSKE